MVKALQAYRLRNVPNDIQVKYGIFNGDAVMIDSDGFVYFKNRETGENMRVHRTELGI